MKYDLPKRIFLLKMFYKIGHLIAIQRAFYARFNTRSPPNHKVIKNIVSVFEKNRLSLTNTTET